MSPFNIIIFAFLLEISTGFFPNAKYTAKTTAWEISNHLLTNRYSKKTPTCGRMHMLSHVCNLKTNDRDEDLTANEKQGQSSRKSFLRFLSHSVVGLSAASASVANAACLTGDTSRDCIGYYKVPLDDNILPYISTPEKLEVFAPGMRWIPPVPVPKNYGDAVNEIRTLQKDVESLHSSILKGDLEEAGSNILGIVPRITVAGKVVIGALYSSMGSKGDVLSMRAYRVETAVQNLQGKLGECDIMIGQGMRGEMGSVTVAQIYILPTIDEVSAEYTELINAIPEGFDPDTTKSKKKNKK